MALSPTSDLRMTLHLKCTLFSGNMLLALEFGDSPLKCTAKKAPLKLPTPLPVADSMYVLVLPLSARS